MNMAKKRVNRKIVGYRDAASGEFVSGDFADEHPETTVAVTEEVPSAQRSFDEYVDAVADEARTRADEEC